MEAELDTQPPAADQAPSTSKTANAPEKPSGSNRRSSWSPLGCIIYVAYLVVSCVYYHVRWKTTLDIHPHVMYGYCILAGEAFGAVCVALYGLSIVRRSPIDPKKPVKMPEKPMSYNVQVMVPCYTEALEIVTETVWAARMAAMPPGCTHTVWLLDDGQDADKEAWVSGLQDPRVRYLSKRRRKRGEVNGKSGNLNNAIEKVYPQQAQLSADDLLAIFDCDQVCHPDFFIKALPLMAESGEIAMVLTPQQFGNVDEASDIFNHTNRHFWEVMIPGLTAWGMLVCTGSNFLVRTAAVRAIGGFPTQTITEDYMLSMELAKRGFKSRYLQLYMATGEAPEEGATFRQRSRWCKGHVQALFSDDNPMLQSRLSLKLKLFYTMGTLSYFCAALTVPLFVSVPVIAVCTGAFPLSLNPTFAVVFPLYFFLMHSVVYFCDSWGLLRALWFGSVSTQILWFTYLKAIINTLLWAAGLKKKGRFKTTIKTGAIASAAARASMPCTPRDSVESAVGHQQWGEQSRTNSGFGLPPIRSRLGQNIALPHDPLGSSMRTDSIGSRSLRRSDTETFTPSSAIPGSPLALHLTGRRPPQVSPFDDGTPLASPKDPHGRGLLNQTLERGLQQRTLERGGSEQPAKPRPLVHIMEADASSKGVQHSKSDVPGVSSGLGSPRFLKDHLSGLRMGGSLGGRSSLSAATLSSLSRVASELQRGLLATATGGDISLVSEPMSLPVINRQMSSGGVRPSWNLQSKPMPAEKAEKGESQAFSLMKVRAVAYGRLRDLWAPLLMLMLSLYAAVMGVHHLATSPRLLGVGSSLPGIVTVLWALYNCIVALVWVFAPVSYNYSEVLDASYQFYEAQRSGVLPFDNRISWRGDSALNDRTPSGASLVGGWYDAGDHLKTSFSTAIATSFLSWGLIQFKQGHAIAGQTHHAKAAVRWAADWLMKAHTGPEEFVGQVGSLTTDHEYWGRPEDLVAKKIQRQVHFVTPEAPGSDMLGAAAAALASASMVHKADDPVWAEKALTHAKSLFRFGAKYPGKFSDSSKDMVQHIPPAHGGNAVYRQHAHALLNESRTEEASRWEYYVTNWDNMLWATTALLGSTGGDADSALSAQAYVDRWRKGEVVNFTSRGLAYSDKWGSLRNVANVAMISFVVAQDLPAAEAAPYECFALSQLRYMLGDGPRSFVVGPLPNPHVLTGALVGGPTFEDQYSDSREDYVTSEVCNAPLTGAGILLST
ncbi:hypothetical protein WJX73_008007 [Symbiochloris irregularis]|uniref:cellulase n=1 Tax=Symbiochloris irregularis TaxID=706552 RepID=A0AAW1PVC2_9CHLO